MLKELRPLLKLLRWVRLFDRIHKGPKSEFVSTDHIEAARSLADPDASEKLWVKIEATNNDYRYSHPEIVIFWKAMFKHMKARGIPVRAFEFTRSMERQNELFDTGRTKARAGQSPHQIHTFRMESKDPITGVVLKTYKDCSAAVDIIHATRGWNLTKKEWDVVGAIGKEIARKRNIDIEWGGDWQFYDPAHWQLKSWKTLLH
jgi:hypothetical protein